MNESATRLAQRPVSSGMMLLIAFVCGAVFALGHAPFNLSVIAVLSLAFGLHVVASSNSASQAARRLLVFGAGHFAVTLNWIVEPFLVDVARHGWMAPFALVLMSLGLSLFWAAAGWFAFRTSRAGASRLLALAAWVALVEVVRAYAFTGFPWGAPGGIWITTPLAQAAALLGAHGLTLVTLIGAALIVVALRPGATSVRAVAAIVLLIGSSAWLGYGLLRETAPDTRTQPPLLRLVQPNATQHLKWDPAHIPIFWERALALTATQSATTPDLVIWPEVSLPYLLGTRPAADMEIVAASSGRPVMVGAQRRDGSDLLNALTVLTPEGHVGGVYDKRHLVPFGEYFPGGAIASWIGLTGLATNLPGGFTAGSGPRLLDLTEIGLGRVLPLICYEIIFPRHARSGELRPDWIVQLTNDAWFGNFAGPQQHLAQARMRAIEQGLPVVRVANTGISAVIDAFGNELVRLDLNEAGYLDAILPPALPPTLHARTGHALAVLLIVASIALVWLFPSIVFLRKGR